MEGKETVHIWFQYERKRYVAQKGDTGAVVTGETADQAVNNLAQQTGLDWKRCQLHLSPKRI